MLAKTYDDDHVFQSLILFNAGNLFGSELLGPCVAVSSLLNKKI